MLLIKLFSMLPTSLIIFMSRHVQHKFVTRGKSQKLPEIIDFSCIDIYKDRCDKQIATIQNDMNRILISMLLDVLPNTSSKAKFHIFTKQPPKLKCLFNKSEPGTARKCLINESLKKFYQKDKGTNSITEKRPRL